MVVIKGNFFEIIVNSLFAGFFIGLANLTNLYLIDNKPLGAFLFAIGLLIIVKQGFYLFTGKVGYIGFSEILKIILVYFLNILGVFIISKYAQQLFSPEIFIAKADGYLNNQTIFTLIFQSIFTGMLMFAAVDCKNDIVTIMCVMAFILLGGKHSIAISFFLPVWEYPIQSLIFALGNALGGQLLGKVKKLNGNMMLRG